MTVEQLPGQVREFVDYLDALLGRLDQGAGWCGVFWQRDPDGMRACLDGQELPPWDVLEALLHDVATAYGQTAARREAERARPLHAAALRAHDARPGGREALVDRLDVMLREQRYAAERQAESGRALTAAGTREEAEGLRLDLAWARDDHERATARCAELRRRLDELERTPAPAPAPEPEPEADVNLPKQRKRRRGSARFAGAAEEEGAAAVVPETAERPEAPAGGRGPRGARFGGGAARKAAAREAAAAPERDADAAAVPETAEAVRRLVALRAEGRSGEAHALLVELAGWPAARIPLLADGLRRAGLGPDWTTLLWEAASLPADRLVAAADALTGAGRAADGEQILRQGVARPAGEIGEAVRDLVADGRRREAQALLDAYVRVRTPEEAARSAAPDPQILVPLLLKAAQGVSEQRHWDLVHALRVAGFGA